jgi:hypothetical protein
LGKRLRRGAARVSYGNPAHLLDAPSYVKEAWDFVSSSSIRNAFSKAELMNLEPEPGAESENNVIAIELAQTIESLNLSINRSELEEFVHIDDESNEEYAVAVLEDVEELLESMKIAMLINQSRLSSHRIELIFMDLSLCISKFSILRISCSVLTFKQKPKKHLTISKNRLKSSRPRSEQSSSKPDAKKTKTCAR